MDNPSYKELNELNRKNKMKRKHRKNRGWQNRLIINSRKQERTFNKSQMNNIKNIDEITFKSIPYSNKWFCWCCGPKHYPKKILYIVN